MSACDPSPAGFGKVTIHELIAAFAAFWWAGSVAALTLSSLVAAVRPRPLSHFPLGLEKPPVTAIVPIKNLESDFQAALSSLFAQTYPRLEISIAAAERESEVIEMAHRIQSDHPVIVSRFFHSETKIAASPKLNTVWSAISNAPTDLVLTADSNIRLESDAVEDFVRHLDPDVGLVSAITIVENPKGLAAWTEASIVNGYHGRILMLARSLGLGFGCGKIMLFRRSDLERAGGLHSLSWALGEDAALTAAMHALGLRTVFANRVSRQFLGYKRWREVWQRHLRWMLIWRVQVPAAFVAELFGAAIPTALAGALAAHLVGWSGALVAALTLGAWCLAEMLVCLAAGWPLSFWSPVAFLAREIMILALWLRALTTNEVFWGEVSCKAGRAPRRERFSMTAGPASYPGDCDR